MRRSLDRVENDADKPPTAELSATAAIAALWAGSARDALAVRTISAQELGPPTRDDVLLVTPDGERAGVLLRGALDDELVALARQHGAGPEAGAVAALTLTVPFEAATARGLTCGGTVEILAQPLATVPVELWDHLAAGDPAVLVTALGPGPARSLAVGADGASAGTLGRADLDDAARHEAGLVLTTPGRGTTRITLSGQPVLVELWQPAPHLAIVGAAALAETLTSLAAQLGWRATTTVDTVGSLAVIEQLTAHDMVVVLEHDPAIATPALAAALGRGVGYVGALGSRRTQTARRDALTAAGVDHLSLEALHGPTGLDLGARTPMETAISIVAEIIATRSGRDPAPLRRTDTTISG